MTENTPFDYVWLGLLIGCFDLGEGGMEQLLEQLGFMGLAATRARVLDAEDNQLNYESDDIGHWVGEELSEKGLNIPYSSGIDIHNSTDLIHLMRPAVWANIPQKAQTDFVEAEKSIRNGQLEAAALVLGRCVEVMMKHFYEQLLPTAEKKRRWSDMENDLFELRDRELIPALQISKDVRLNYRNLTSHGDKEYDKYEVTELWHLSVLAVSRMARVMERRCPLPDSA